MIGVADEPESLDPLRGYAPLGAAKVFDGLVEHDPVRALRPVLAAELPGPSSDGRSWTVRLRDDVSFSDGSAFDSADVVATYRALLVDSAPLRSRFWMLAGVEAIDKTTVRFDLTRPYAAFADLLVLGVRSESDIRADPAEPPVGTGPYQVAEWVKGERLVLAANQAYFAGAPAITKVTVEFVPDDEVRAQRMREGKLDGTELPARLATGFAGVNGLAVVEHSSAGLLAVSLPDGPVTGDPAVRLALNLAVDREALVERALGGRGAPTSLPVPSALAEFVEPGAAIKPDLARAREVLDAAGWAAGGDGVRSKGDTLAAFEIGYPVADVTARDLVAAFAQAAREIGVTITAAPTPRGSAAQGPRLVAFGDPVDPDLSLYPLLHPAGGDLAAALDAARATTDPAQRAAAFRALQRAYASAPTMVVLAAPTHSYVMRENWTGYEPVVDATGADHTWGAWWNLQRWAPR
ncbi:peptide/nickel transport system substrate-binding protein [Actinokineospora iranica]|uniref:Peptide/nickel transport system substrate-binding protein n=1 Tax=Actinokineospora iranica TaxID=1271860 RepID=A0A1G6KD92_9PSEU|nr:peptide/nickel transport system substrate-binding protein [Actinokineospora iranica]